MYRTQIYLPKELREQLNQQLAKTNESLAEYLRKAAIQRLQKDQEETQNLNKLASNLGKNIKKSGWKDMDRSQIINWQSENRKDRD